MQRLELTITAEGTGALGRLKTALDRDSRTTRRDDPHRGYPAGVDVISAVLTVDADTYDGARAHIARLIAEALRGVEYEYALS